MREPLDRVDTKSSLGTLAVEDPNPPDTAYPSSEPPDAVEQTDCKKWIGAVIGHNPIQHGDMYDGNRIRRIAQIERKAEKHCVLGFVRHEKQTLRIWPLRKANAEMVPVRNDLRHAELLQQFHDAAANVALTLVEEHELLEVLKVSTRQIGPEAELHSPPSKSGSHSRERGR